MMQFTGWQYLLIDLANTFGLDKETFEKRIKWAEDNLHQLESLLDQADSKPLYHKAVLAIRKAQAGLPTGHLVELDACCSGLQIMSVLTGCIAGATATGLVDPHVRADAYSTLTEVMEGLLGSSVGVSRKDAKNAYMTCLYGSKEEPKKIFGEDTPELNAFYQAAQQIGPGAWDLLQTLLASWQPYALMHAWKLPDGFDARVKVMEKQSVRIEVDELDHASFTYEYYENVGQEKGLSNAANVIHSIDAYVLRCVHRRCNYDRGMIERALDHVYSELLGNNGMAVRLGNKPRIPLEADTKLAYYVGQYQRSGMADIVIAPYITSTNVAQLETRHLEQLRDIMISMLVHQPFPIVTIHDAYKCHPNNVNHLRQHYINVLAELAESNVLSDILSQIYGTKGVFPKLNNNLGQLIRNSNYALS